MKKIMAFILALTLTISLAACGGGTTGGSSVGSGVSQTAVSLTGEISGEITVSCYDSMRYKQSLEDAAKAFEEKYPGTKVNVETFSAMPEIQTSEQGGRRISMVTNQDDPQGRTDYINKTNTALMSGEGADILAMDVLPVQKYVESGQLENLGTYMDADTDFNRDDYRKNILDAVTWQGGTWFIPMDYSFNYYTYDSTLISADAANFGIGSAFSTTQLMELGMAAYDGSAKLFNMQDFGRGMGGGSMWSRLFSENYTTFVDISGKTANFDDGKFVSLLESVKKYGEEGYIPQSVIGQTDPGAMMQRDREAPTERYFFKPNSNMSLLSYYNRGSGRQMVVNFGGAAAIVDDDEIAGIQANADGSVPFTYSQAYGVNSNSGNKETAWAFIKFLMSGEFSGGMGPRGLPLNNESRSRYIDLMLSNVFSQRTGGTGQAARAANPEDIPQEVLEKFYAATEQFSDQINTWEVKDTTADDMISAEVQYFFDGSKTAGEVAKMLQNKVGLYLSE